MTIAYQCVLIAALLPYLTVGFAKAGSGYNNARPRESMAELEGYRARAYAAHANGFEAFPFFAAVILMAAQTGADALLVNRLAVVFIVARVLYVVAYIADRPLLRSIVWAIGFFACFGIGAFAIAA